MMAMNCTAPLNVPPLKPMEEWDSNQNDTSFVSQVSVQCLWILVVFLSIMCRSYLPENFNFSNFIGLFATVLKALASVSDAKSMAEIISRPFEEYEMWEEPPTSEELFGGSTKIIWGFWNSYPNGFPWLCQRALESWQLRNPGWKVIMLNDSNFRKYVSTKDLPSTFYSLKVQHRSDLIRLAVLIRYGGVYLDASTLVYKGFDGIWETAEDDKVLITSLNQLPEPGLDFFNNGLLMAKGTNNPFLLEWRRRIIEYSENPALSLEAMRRHHAFRRVHQHFDDPTLGVLGSMVPYHCNLWLLNDMIWHNDLRLSKHIVHLPKIRWGFFYHSMPYFFDLLKVMSSKEAQDPVNNPEFVEWTSFSLFNIIVKHIKHGFYDNFEVANGVIDNVHLLKFTSHDMPLIDFAMNKLGYNTTVGRIFTSAYDVGKAPLIQANLAGSRPPALAEGAAKL